MSITVRVFKDEEYYLELEVNNIQVDRITYEGCHALYKFTDGWSDEVEAICSKLDRLGIKYESFRE